MNELAQLIRREIQASGPISCARFMELALYHPELGYYEREARQTGRRGDFYTSVSVGSLFGELLAFKVAGWLGSLAPSRASSTRKTLQTRTSNAEGHVPPPAQEPTPAPLPGGEQATQRFTEVPLLGGVGGGFRAPIPAKIGSGAAHEPASRSGVSAEHPRAATNPPAARCGDSATPRPFQIAEAGAHDGRLALDILSWCRQQMKERAEEIEYWIIEPSARRRSWQEKTLSAFQGSVRWFSSWESVPPRSVHGVILSNELLDAFPVHRLGWNAQAKVWFEWGVNVVGDGFEWVALPNNSARDDGAACSFPWPRLPDELLEVLPNGFTTEICPGALAWWRQAANALGEGKLITLDFGLASDQFFSPERAGGTLRAYHRHHQNSDPLGAVGEQDLTADVNFSALRSAGEESGLHTDGLFSQSEFLIGIAEEAWNTVPSLRPSITARTRQLQTLTHPEHLGRSFRVLVQSRQAR